MMEGVDALLVQKIRPLRFIIKYDRYAQTGYSLKITREHAINLTDRKEHAVYLSSPGGRGDYFSLKEVQGPPESPTALVLEMNDTKETATVTPDKPYERVEGFGVDLRYDLENRNFPDIRKNTIIRFAGDAYKIVAIEKNAVRLRANSNGKQSTIKWNAAP